jgi:hypothetical protein
LGNKVICGMETNVENKIEDAIRNLYELYKNVKTIIIYAEKFSDSKVYVS